MRGPPPPLFNQPPCLDRQDKSVPPHLAPERRARGIDDKLSTLRDYWRSRGLYFRCGEKWSRDHRCPEAIQLHALQELWEVCFSGDCQEDGYDLALMKLSCVLLYLWLLLEVHPLSPLFSSWGTFRVIQFAFSLILAAVTPLSALHWLLSCKVSLFSHLHSRSWWQMVRSCSAPLNFRTSFGLFRLMILSLKLRCCRCLLMS